MYIFVWHSKDGGSILMYYKTRKGCAKDTFLKDRSGIWVEGIEHQEQATTEKDTYSETVEMGKETINKGLLEKWIIWPSD